MTLPIISLWGILKLLILQHTWYNSSSDTSNIVFIHCWHVSLHYFCIFDFVWRHRWRHMDMFESSAFSVNNFRAHWDRESIKAPLCSHWALKSTAIDLTHPARSVTLGSVAWPWPRGRPWLWPLPIKKYIIRRDLMRELRWCLNFHSTATCNGVMRERRKPNPDLWVFDLTSEVTGWLDILNLGTNLCV